MTPYADTNFFTRVYLQMPGSAEADLPLLAASRNAAAPLPLTWLHRLEMLNALQLHVFQARSQGQPFISAEQTALAHANFRGDALSSEFLRPAVIPVAELERQFEELSLRHTARHGFRTSDLLHVASALLLGCDTFWTFDAKSMSLAKLEGLKVR